MTLLNGVIAAGQLSEFVDLIIKKREEERDWEYYLHKVFDKSFNDFTDDVDREAHDSLARQTFDVETTLQDSMDLVMNFSPEE